MHESLVRIRPFLSKMVNSCFWRLRCYSTLYRNGGLCIFSLACAFEENNEPLLSPAYAHNSKKKGRSNSCLDFLQFVGSFSNPSDLVRYSLCLVAFPSPTCSSKTCILIPSEITSRGRSKDRFREPNSSWLLTSLCEVRVILFVSFERLFNGWMVAHLTVIPLWPGRINDFSIVRFVRVSILSH